MAKRRKQSKSFDLNQQQMSRQPFAQNTGMLSLSNGTAKQKEDKQIVRKAVLLPHDDIKDYSTVAMGTEQKYNTAPLNVPAGFTTEIPYNTTINSTIIANPSPIPVTDFYKAMTTDPVVYSCMLYIITTIMARS